MYLLLYIYLLNIADLVTAKATLGLFEEKHIEQNYCLFCVFISNCTCAVLETTWVYTMIKGGPRN